jgi:hypothetical protein
LNKRYKRCIDLDVDENMFEWITPQFLNYCRRIRRIRWRFLADGNSELLEDNVLIRWSIYGTNNILLPNLVTVAHSWHSLDTMDQENILRINKITARSPLQSIVVDVEDLDLSEDEEAKVFGEYTGVVYDFIAGLPNTITSLKMTHRCMRRSLLPMPPLNTFTRLSSLRRLDIGWYLSSNELITLTSLVHLESLSINLSSEECLPSVTYASLRSLDVTIQSAFPQKCGLERLKAPHLHTITCWLRNQPDDEDVIQFAGLLGERKQTRSITFWDCDQGSDGVRESSMLIRILENLSHAHAITLHMRFDLGHADKSSIEAACGLHLSELQLPGCIVAQRVG